MIYPSTTGKAGELARLRTLESVWIQGKLKMWGRWSTFSDMPEAVNMFRRLLSRNTITRDDLKAAIIRLRRAGCSNAELELWLTEMLNESTQSSLVYCTDDEGILMNQVIGSTLLKYPGLLDILKLRYLGQGRSKREVAEIVRKDHPEISFKTCQRRVDVWLSVAEKALYMPMSDAFSVNPERFCS